MNSKFESSMLCKEDTRLCRIVRFILGVSFVFLGVFIFADGMASLNKHICTILWIKNNCYIGIILGITLFFLGCELLGYRKLLAYFISYNMKILERLKD